MSPARTESGVPTKLLYRKPPPSPEFLTTPVDLYSHADNWRDEREVFIRNIRSERDRFTIEKDGLEFLKDEVDIKNWDDEAEIWDVILKKTPELVKKRLGATHTFITASRIRRSDSSGIKSDTTPVFNIHGDSTRQSGLELVHTSLPKMPFVPKNLPPSGHVMLLNVWRPLKTITRDPLAFLVPSSVKPEDRHEQIFQRPPNTFKVFGKPIGNYWLDTVSYNDQHEWVFLEHQGTDEPVMFVQWDSKGVEAGSFESRMSILHSSFVDDRYIDEPERASIELKMLVFFEE